MKIVTALLLASALMTAGQAAAQSTEATLQDLSGKVLMNKGDGLVSGKAGAALVDGDRIVTLDKSVVAHRAEFGLTQEQTVKTASVRLQEGQSIDLF